MDKKEFVQRFVIENYEMSGTTEDKIQRAIVAYNLIEKAFVVTPTTNLWDYNDMQR
jgi:hypothetical protein